MIKIMKATKKDLGLIIGLEGLIFGRAKTLKNLENIYNNDQTLNTVIAYFNGKIAGFGIAKEDEQKYYIWLVGVLDNFRGKGIGKKIVLNNIRFARKKGYKEIFFKTSNKRKEMAILGLKMGFNIVGFNQNQSMQNSQIILNKNI